MQVFRLIRHEDETGISGAGNVIDGVIFEDGTVVVRWKTETPSTAIYKDWDAFRKVHVDPHPENKSEIQYIEIDWMTNQTIFSKQMELK